MFHFDPNRLPFTPLDMLMPTRLLEKTNWRDNPLVAYAKRRAHRRWRFILARLLELMLIDWLSLVAVFFFYLALKRNEAVPNSRWLLSFLYEDNYHSNGELKIQSPEMYVFILLIAPFFLLRYHLFVNNHSCVMENLSRDRLGELLLTKLDSREFFLHDFLLLCRRYWALVAWATVWAGFLILDISTDGALWIQPYLYRGLFATLHLILLVWIAGVLQYVIEWNLFAGRNPRFWRWILSLILSAILWIGICFAYLGVWVVEPIRDYFEGGPPNPMDEEIAIRLLYSFLTLIIPIVIAWVLAIHTTRIAETTLKTRFEKSSHRPK